ncbi:MAG: hypothetical protein Q7S95_02375 [bacterium]|nr:hypothetical protein [bacterium]
MPLTAQDILRKAVARGTRATTPLFVLNYFASGEYHRKLRQAGFDTTRTLEFEHNDVYVFTKEELDSLLKKAGLCVSKKAPSRTKGVEWVWLCAVPDLPRSVLARMGDTLDLSGLRYVNIGEWRGDGKSSDYAYITAAMLYPLLKRPIQFSVPHGITMKYRPDGPFQVYIWSSPGDEKEKQPPARIWGIRTGCRDRAFVPAQGGGRTRPGDTMRTGIAICDGRYAVAELFPNALYVHHDLVHEGIPEELELYAELLKRCQLLLTGPEAFAVYLERAEKERIEAEKMAFPLLVERSVEKRAERHKNAVEAAERAVAEKKHEYFDAERKLFAERQALLDPEVMKVRFLAEYEKLATGKVELIKGITFDPTDGDTITLHTGEITIDHPRDGTTRLIGGCDVTYNLETGEVVSIVNRDRQPRADEMTYHTPHVFRENGRNVCLGNIGGELAAYIAHYEIEAAAVLTVAFLQSVRDDERYLRYLEYFPVIKKGVPA